MKLREEKKLIIIEVVLLMFVALTGIGIQLCSNQIDNYNSKLLQQDSLLNLTENVRISQKISSLKYLFCVFTDANVDVDFEEAYSNPDLDAEYIQIVKDYESGKISKNDYFNKLSVKHNRENYALFKKYLSLLKGRELLTQNKPIWLKVRDVLFVFQFGAVTASILIYYFVYKSIDKRPKNQSSSTA
jgi:hypothetical protein